MEREFVRLADEQSSRRVRMLRLGIGDDAAVLRWAAAATWS